MYPEIICIFPEGKEYSEDRKQMDMHPVPLSCHASLEGERENTMSRLYYLHCHYCGEPLSNRESPYCPSCNLYLCYRAMPFLLGMILTGRLATDLATAPSTLELVTDTVEGYDDERSLVWE